MAGIQIPTEQATSNTPQSTRKAWVNAYWGLWGGSVLGALASLKTNDFKTRTIIGYIGTALGALGGYFIGKNSGERIDEQAKVTGKTEVKTPTFWNYKLGKSLVFSALASAGLYLSSNMFIANSPLTAGLASGLTLLVGVGSFIYGGVSGKQEMRADYDRAREIEKGEMQKSIVQEIQKSQSPQVAAGASEQVSKTNFTATEGRRRAAAESAVQNSVV